MLRRGLPYVLVVLAVLALGAPSRAAQPAFQVIVNPKNPVDSVDTAFLRRVYLKKARTWSGGRAVRPIDLPRKVGARDKFTREVLKKTPAQLRSYWSQQVFSGKGTPPPEADDVEEAIDYVLANKGAVAYIPADVDPGGCKVIESNDGRAMSFRAKLFAIVAVDALALLVLVLASSLIERRVDHKLDAIQRHYVPRIGLAPRLNAAFERVSRTLQDAAAAGDEDLLADARTAEQALLADLAAAGDAIDPGAVEPLRGAIETWYAAASDVSAKLIAGEDAEDEAEAMQVRQTEAADLLAKATRFDEHELARAFASVADAQSTGGRIRLIASLACLVSILGLSMWVGRGLFRSLNELGEGFRRFGAGQFDVQVPVTSTDELGEVAHQANQMAARLRSLDWIRTGHAGLVEHLHGEMEPEEVAARAVAFLARHVGAPIAAIYYQDPAGAFGVLGTYGSDGAAPGVGLVAEAARRTEITVIEATAEDPFRIRTGLVELRPRAVVLVPLLHLGNVTGVLELVMSTPWSEEAAELMRGVRESLTITIEVARARAATRELLAETQRQARELVRANTYKSEFLASMSHELRTPLNAIIGFAELMHDGLVEPDSPQHQEFLAHILASGRHLLQLINDVLDLSKVEAGKLELHPEAIVLTNVVREVLGILRTTAANGKVKIESKIDPSIDALVLDPGRLKQVLYNFLSNAIKFTPAGGTVTLRATPEDATAVRIEVEDTGVGISEEDLAKLFNEFQQVGDGRKAGGSGLGLALTRRMVEAQGGTVGVRSVVGKGSVFHALLPRATRAEQTPRARKTIAPPTNARTVLVVEDDPDDGAELAGALEAAGYAVELVRSGAHALARAKERVFDAITLDLLLTDMSGLDVLRQLRADGKHDKVPVVVVTVIAEPGAVAGFVVNDILPKPIDTGALLASLTRAGVPPSATSDVLVVDDDPASLQLMSAMLDQLGYQSRCETDARSALAGLTAVRPTAIVLDLMMPEMSGFDFLDQLRGSAGGKDVPVIVWTSKDLSSDEHARLCASATAIVAKGGGGSQGVISELAAHLPPRPAS